MLFITVLESVYLFYMFFVFKTERSFGPALLDIQSHGSFFVHDTGVNENKVCPFGKVMAVIAIGLAFLRLLFLHNKELVVKATIGFDLLCISMAALMNLNAVIYILPLIIGESIILNSLL